jgi:DNA repair exonuclease SbcCD ATPase subunit
MAKKEAVKKKARRTKAPTRSPFPPGPKVAKKKTVKVKTRRYDIHIAGDNLNGMKLIKDYKILEAKVEKLEKRLANATSLNDRLQREVRDVRVWLRNEKGCCKAAQRSARMWEKKAVSAPGLEEALREARTAKAKWAHYQPARTKARDVRDKLEAVRSLLKGLPAAAASFEKTLKKLEEREKEAPEPSSRSKRKTKKTMRRKARRSR